MANESVIRSFLVSLGFRQDTDSLKKFTDGIETATKTVVGLAAAIESTALAVAIGTARFAESLENLWFAANKSGASALNLKAFDRAARDMGVSAGEAMGSVDSLARFLRNNPGGEGVLASWFGVEVTDKNGNKRDMVDVLMDIGRAMQRMPQWQAQMFGGDLGLSEDTIRALQNGDFAANYEKIHKTLANAGFVKAAADAHKFMTSLRNLGDQFTVFGTQIYEAIQSKLKFSLDTLTNYLAANGPRLAAQVVDILREFLDWFNRLLTWLEVHGPAIATMIGEALGAIKRYGEAAKPILEWIWNQFVKLDAATDGWSTKLLLLGAALKFMGATEIIGGVLGLAAAFVKLGAGLATASAGATAGGAGGALALVSRLAGGVGLGITGGYLLDKYFPNNWLARMGDALGGQFYRMNSAGNKENLIQMLNGMGWTVPQAQGIVNTLGVESNLNPYAVGDDGQAFGLAQWHPDRQADFERLYGHKMGSLNDRDADLKEQMEFMNWEMRNKFVNAGNLLRAADSEQMAREVFVRQYERPADPDREIARGNPSISTVNTFHIDGSGQDPRATAHAIAAEQDRVNAALIREFAAQVQ